MELNWTPAIPDAGPDRDHDPHGAHVEKEASQEALRGVDHQVSLEDPAAPLSAPGVRFVAVPADDTRPVGRDLLSQYNRSQICQAFPFCSISSTPDVEPFVQQESLLEVPESGGWSPDVQERRKSLSRVCNFGGDTPREFPELESPTTEAPDERKTDGDGSALARLTEETLALHRHATDRNQINLIINGSSGV